MVRQAIVGSPDWRLTSFLPLRPQTVLRRASRRTWPFAAFPILASAGPLLYPEHTTVHGAANFILWEITILLIVLCETQTRGLWWGSFIFPVRHVVRLAPLLFRTRLGCLEAILFVLHVIAGVATGVLQVIAEAATRAAVDAAEGGGVAFAALLFLEPCGAILLAHNAQVGTVPEARWGITAALIAAVLSAGARIVGQWRALPTCPLEDEYEEWREHLSMIPQAEPDSPEWSEAAARAEAIDTPIPFGTVGRPELAFDSQPLPRNEAAVFPPIPARQGLGWIGWLLDRPGLIFAVLVWAVFLAGRGGAGVSAGAVVVCLIYLPAREWQMGAGRCRAVPRGTALPIRWWPAIRLMAPRLFLRDLSEVVPFVLLLAVTLHVRWWCAPAIYGWTLLMRGQQWLLPRLEARAKAGRSWARIAVLVPTAVVWPIGGLLVVLWALESPMRGDRPAHDVAPAIVLLAMGVLHFGLAAAGYGLASLREDGTIVTS